MNDHLTHIRDLAHLVREVQAALDVRAIRKRTGAAMVQPIVTLTVAYDAKHADKVDVPLRMVCLRMTSEQATQIVARLQTQERMFG